MFMKSPVFSYISSRSSAKIIVSLLLSISMLTACGGSDSKEATSTQDTVAPVITLNGESSITLSVGAEYIDLGATAQDVFDGNIEVTTTGIVDGDVVENYTLTYSAVDSAGNIGTLTRIVKVVDDIAPVIVITGYNPLTHSAGDIYTDEGATATDNVDEANTIAISSKSNVDSSKLGEYSITYLARDAAGNYSKASRIVNVVDLKPPVITLKGDANANHNIGHIYNDLGAIATDTVDSSVTVTTTSDLDIDIIGHYSITYSATDAAGNEAIPVIRTINVDDFAAPVITLNGDSSITLGQGRVYNELGATAFDELDGEIVLDAPVGVVNTEVVGQYQLTYTATNSVGKLSTLVRTVDVVIVRPFIITTYIPWPLAAQYTFTMPTNDSYNYDYNIHWGYGALIEDNLTSDASHTYWPESETFGKDVLITISGIFPAINTGFCHRLRNITQWGDIEWQSMHRAFSDCEYITIVATDAPDLSKVNDMSYIFSGATYFNSDISHWDVSNVTIMTGTFQDATDFDQDLSQWQISSVSDMSDMFSEVTLSTENYDALLLSWSQQDVQTDVIFDAGNSQYSPASEAARSALINTYGWVITDGGPAS